MSKENVNRQISIFINDREVKNSLGGIEKEMGKVRGQLKNLVKGTDDYDAKLKEGTSALEQLKKKQIEYREELQLTNQAASEGTANFSRFIQGFKTGNLFEAKEGLLGIKGSIVSITEASLAFIATPLGAAIAVLSGFAAGAKYVFDFNQEAEKSTRIIENLTGKTGQVVEDIRIMMQSLVDTFGIQFDALANAVDNLVDTGVAKDELSALEQIKKGLLTAPDKNEFVSGLEAAAVTAKEVGLNLEEVISLKKEIEKTGVNPEATFGAITKATKNLLEQSDNLRNSLSSALGAAFTDEILTKLKTGEITTVQALERINAKSKEVGLNQSQQAQLSADIFGKSALAAGGYEVILDTVTGALKLQREELNANQQALSDLADANQNVNKAQSLLFRVKDFGELWDKIKAKVINAISGVLFILNRMKYSIEDIFYGGLNVFKKFNNGIIDQLEGLAKSSSVILKALGVDVQGLVKGLDSLKSKDFYVRGTTENKTVDSSGGDKNSQNQAAKAAAFEIYINKQIALLEKKQAREEALGKDSYNTEKAILELKLKLQKKGSDEYEQIQNSILKLTTEHNKKVSDEAKKSAETKRKLDQEEFARALALAKSKLDLAKAEIDYFIAFNQSKLESGKKLTLESIAEETKRLEEIKFQRDSAIAEERIVKLTALQQQFDDHKITLEAFNAEKQAIDLATLTAEQLLNVEFYKTTDQLKKQYDEEQKQLLIEQKAADEELALAEADSQYEKDRIEAEQKNAAELERYKKMRDNKIITEQEYNAFAKQSAEDLAKFKAKQDLQMTANGLNGLSTLANAMGELFGQSKELAILQANISGAQAILSIWAAPASLPQPYDAILKGVLTAATVVTTVKQIKEINKQKPPKKARFFHGGDTSFASGGDTGHKAALGHDEYCSVTGVVHDGEWVMPKIMKENPRYSAHLGWLENERRKIYGNKHFEGGPSSSNAPMPTPEAPNDAYGSTLIMAINKLIGILENGIVAKAIIGYKEAEDIETLNDERKASSQNGSITS
ncbi:hypothetical protein [Flavobacterium sp. 3HN19-14]|uniref:hypothetical protein n=1 Tax=Flavobacterium sp. 3HN19-14 TaxID=3448133 RepID=UPI003EE2E5FF